MTTGRVAVLFLIFALWGTQQATATAKASCKCRLTLVSHDSANPKDYRAIDLSCLSEAQKQIEFEGKVGYLKSCKNFCKASLQRPYSPDAGAARRTLAKKAAELGRPFNWCGGWLNAKLEAKKGRFKWKDVGGGLYGITPVRTCPSVPPGLATSCCCGSNHLIVFRDTFPNFEWALSPEGHFLRFWWDQQGQSEMIRYSAFNEPLVSGTLRRDPFGDGVVALSDKGHVVRTVKENGRWRAVFLARRTIEELGGALPCGMLSTFNSDSNGIWIITESRIVRFEIDDGGRWRHASVEIGQAAKRIDTSSLYEISDGRIAGTLSNGQRWNIWFEDNDSRKMRFGYSGGEKVAVSPSAECGHATGC